MKVKLKMWVGCQKDRCVSHDKEWGVHLKDGFEYYLSYYKFEHATGQTVEVEFDLDDDFNPISGEIEKLEKQKAFAVEKHNEVMVDLEQKLNELKAITYEKI